MKDDISITIYRQTICRGLIPTGPPLVLPKKIKYTDWASPKITKFSKCQTGPPLKSSL